MLEISAVVLILFYLYYARKTNPYAWVFGILASVASVFFFYKQAYYGSAVLNLIYGMQGFLGYVHWKWLHPKKKAAYALTWPYHVAIAVFCFLVSLLLYSVFQTYQIVEFIYLDILLALFSISATFLEIRKDTSCWWYWILCNTGYALLYAFQGKNMVVYASLMLGLAVFSYVALKAWESDMLNTKEQADAQANKYQSS